MTLDNNPRIQPGSMHPYGALPVPQVTPDMLGLVRTGKVYSLAVTHYEGIPVPGPMVPYTLSPRLRHGDVKDIPPASAAAEVVTMAAHTGTHIDALCHIGEHRDANGSIDPNGEVYLHGGVLAKDTVNFRGQTHLSIAEMPPIVTRAVLLDVARHKDVDVLPDGYVISAQDIADTLAAQSTEVRPGTAVLMRTGFYQHLRDGNYASYADAIAGPGLEAAQYLFERGMMLAGADNMTVEAFPPRDHAVHRFLLVKNGVTHLENLYLEALSAERVYEFLLIVTPLRLQGATGSWVHPIAIA
ncbi:MAG: cyclase family protein [Burkholderiales bacterium]|nr:cyclase family protein [Anaerolineae bacterium]